MTRLRPLLLLALLASGDRLMAMPEPTPLTMNLAHGMAALTPPLAAASGPPPTQEPAAGRPQSLARAAGEGRAIGGADGGVRERPPPGSGEQAGMRRARWSLPATQGEGHWPRYARVTLMAQAPPPSPTPVPAPAPEGDGGGPFRPSEDVPADAEVDFPGDI